MRLNYNDDKYVHVYYSRIGEDLEESLPNLESLILTNNSIQELGDLDTLSTLKNLKYLRYIKYLF